MKRFWSKVRADGTGCFVWVGCLGTRGYGQFFFQGKSASAHRFVWTLMRGPIPPGLQVLHSCDNPLCVNPDHLFLGTNEDNHADKVAKGRQGWLQGIDHPRAKFTDDDIRLIRKSPRSAADLAETFDVTPGAIYFIRQRITWKHVQ